jgi:hypothetical protein
MKKILYFLIFTAGFFAFAKTSEAATLNVSLGNDVYNVGDQFSIHLHIDSEGVSINAAQATLDYPADILEVTGVNKSGSIFVFWLLEPDFSVPGKISFVGGSTSGYIGKSLQVLTVNFKVKASGVANLSLGDAAVTLADGTGADVIRTTGGARITAQEKTAAPPAEPPPSRVLPPPVQIVREPVVSKAKPTGPKIEIPLYPDPEKWYNTSANFLVRWDLPADIVAVATEINKIPDFEPTKTEGLFDNKMFARPDDGIWYLHVRFKNNIGLGPTTHYRVAVDTSPPTSFDVTVLEGATTDNPTPTINFESGDQLSGLSKYLIRVDNGDLVLTDKTSYTLPLLPPGKHTVRVSAKDNADNLTEEILNLEILPIAAPLITSVSRDIFIGEGGLNVSGTALPDLTILISLKRTNGEEILKKETQSDADGLWLVKFDESLKKDKYYIEVTAKDKRGALSLPVKSDTITVRERPLLTIRGVEITQLTALVSLIILLLLAFTAGWYARRLTRKQRQRKITIAERDTAALLNLIKKDLDKIMKSYGNGKLDKREMEEVKQVLKKVEENLNKMQKYVVPEIGEI